MTGIKQLFVELDEGKEGTVTFGNDQSARIVGKGTVCLNNKKIMVESVLLVEEMEHNLLSVIQTCDKGIFMIFDSKGCQIRDIKSNKLVGTAIRTSSNIYILDEEKEKCYLGSEDESWLWHKRLGHINFENMIQWNKKEAIRDLPVIKDLSSSLCKQCQHGKQTRVKFKTKEHSTTKPLEIVHADVCGPMRTTRLKGERYFLLSVNEFTRMTWMFLLKKKSESFSCFQTFKESTENECDMKIKCLRSDNGGEFVSKEFNRYCDENGIRRHFSVIETPQQNGVVERKNRTVMEMARTMLNESKLSNILWPQVHTVVHILNRILLRNNHFKTPYQLWKGRPASVKHFRMFGSKCYIKRVDKHLGKLESRTDEGILVGYSCSRKSYKCYNFRLKKIVESIDVKFDESSFLKSKSKQKNHQIYEINDKHKMNDEVSEIEETKAADSEQLIPTLT
jgi:hypothetical protein